MAAKRDYYRRRKPKPVSREKWREIMASWRRVLDRKKSEDNRDNSLDARRARCDNEIT